MPLHSVLLLGLDVGSTTVKVAVLEPTSRQLLYSRYERHQARQAATVQQLLQEVAAIYPDTRFRLAVCGSGGSGIAQTLGAFFIQEVVANAIAIRAFHGTARVAIELGGQDAKVIFFEHDPGTGALSAADLRMNGSCAGGTGAFIDQMAELLQVSPEEFGALAAEGRTVHAISGRCGVFAKTDIQPLINQGVPAADLALSCFHAIAKQTIGGLAQGAEIHPPVIFEGGPLTFNPRLVEVFAERLGLAEEQIIVPEHPEVIVAIGAALAADPAYSARDEVLELDALVARLTDLPPATTSQAPPEAFFVDEAARQAFFARHAEIPWAPPEVPAGTTLGVYLGIDAGSTTSKLVLIDAAGQLVDRFYASNAGEPLAVVQRGLLAVAQRWAARGVTLEVLGLGTTGYGELLFARAFRADYHTVETVSHAQAAIHYDPDVSFILDIGGQDMKAISLKGGIVTGIVLNEACSAGCGSFLETYARSLQIPVERVAELAFAAASPSRLGSRCTVFMNSCIVTEQRNGKTPEDLMAGLCRSVVENVFTKVVRVANFDSLGERVMVQGGTFKNDAVLRAMEQYTGRPVIRAPFPGEMGALGVALLTRQHMERLAATGQPARSTFLGFEAVTGFRAEQKPGTPCPFCSNHCTRTLVEFGHGDRFVTGNRCERGEVLESPREAAAKIKEITERMDAVPDLFKVRNRLIFKDYGAKPQGELRGIRMGLPRVLEYWQSLPFWKAFLVALGFEVVLSGKSSYPIFESGLQHVPSDTVCFPAKLVHGHVADLVARGVDRVFLPVMNVVRVRETDETTAVHMCAVVQGYPIIIKENDEPERRHGVKVDAPSFHWYNRSLRDAQLEQFFGGTFGISKREIKLAIAAAEAAQDACFRELRMAGREVLAALEGTDRMAVVLAGRPYHHDELVHHGVPGLFTALGVPVLTLDAIAELEEVDLHGVRADRVNPFHTQLFAAAKYVATHPNLQLAQLISFGCGHDAVNSDELIRILGKTSGKQLLMLKVDEGEAQGPLKIRVKSFVETLFLAAEVPADAPAFEGLGEAFEVRFTRADKALRTVLIPNLSPAFSAVASGVLRSKGYRIETLPLADARAKELGKRYVHNDICYPAQINVGELLAALERGTYQSDEVAVAVAKNCDDCRAGQYATLARKALDEAGYPELPIVTTGEDRAAMHPGFQLGLWWQLGMLHGLAIADGLEEMLRKTRPYELEPGACEQIFAEELVKISEALSRSHRAALQALEGAIARFNAVPVDRSVRRPRVLIIGEILLNYHPTANEDIVRYLEAHGLEPVLPSMIDFFRRDLVRVKEGVKRNLLPNPLLNWAVAGISDWLYEQVIQAVEGRLQRFRYHEARHSVHDLADLAAEYIDKTFTIGEGWAIPAEIMHHASQGVTSFAIVQPFGCLPNHITGRGMMKVLKARYPGIKIIALDYDADTSFANIENRLQMLIMAQREVAAP